MPSFPMGRVEANFWKVLHLSKSRHANVSIRRANTCFIESCAGEAIFIFMHLKWLSRFPIGTTAKNGCRQPIYIYEKIEDPSFV
jgi:hypothetical protein